MKPCVVCMRACMCVACVCVYELVGLCFLCACVLLRVCVHVYICVLVYYVCVCVFVYLCGCIGVFLLIIPFWFIQHFAQSPWACFRPQCPPLRMFYALHAHCIHTHTYTRVHMRTLTHAHEHGHLSQAHAHTHTRTLTRLAHAHTYMRTEVLSDSHFVCMVLFNIFSLSCRLPSVSVVNTKMEQSPLPRKTLDAWFLQEKYQEKSKRWIMFQEKQ